MVNTSNILANTTTFLKSECGLKGEYSDKISNPISCRQTTCQRRSVLE